MGTTRHSSSLANLHFTSVSIKLFNEKDQKGKQRKYLNKFHFQIRNKYKKSPAINFHSFKTSKGRKRGTPITFILCRVHSTGREVT